MAAEERMKVAVKAASYNVILQIIFRLGTFCMNAVLLRYISREILGVVNVRLTLLYTTILFISRESFRKACLSSTKDNKESGLTGDERKRIINLIWICVLVGFISSAILSFIWIFYFDQPSIELLYQYKICTIIIAISAVFELMLEPLWIFGQRSSFVSLKVVLEGVYLTLRCVISISLVVLFPSSGLYPFGIAFLVAAVTYVFLYYAYFWWYINAHQNNRHKTKNDFPFEKFRDLFPDLQVTPLIDAYYTNLVVSFYKQSLLKQFLTEGERYVMTIFSILSFGEQGIYDVINNLGSLAARFIFMPVEESYYIFFSQMLIRGKSAKEHPPSVLKQSSDALSIVLKFVSLIGFIILIFGYNYSYLLLDLYGGSILSQSEGPILLKTYCLYVLVIAVNGITECFMFAAMSKVEVDRYNFKMLLFSAMFLISSLILTKYLGAVGFVLANCLNMALRIGQSVKFIRKFFEDTSHRPLLSIFPTAGVAISLFATFIVISVSENLFCCAYGLLYRIVHICVGATCLLCVILMIYFTEHELISFVKDFIKKRKDKIK